MPDKTFGYSFPCDGPGRGGTCDISAELHSTYVLDVKQLVGQHSIGIGNIYGNLGW
jgi:hypothetical protein